MHFILFVWSREGVAELWTSGKDDAKSERICQVHVSRLHGVHRSATETRASEKDEPCQES